MTTMQHDVPPRFSSPSSSENSGSFFRSRTLDNHPSTNAIGSSPHNTFQKSRRRLGSQYSSTQCPIPLMYHENRLEGDISFAEEKAEDATGTLRSSSSSSMSGANENVGNSKQNGDRSLLSKFTTDPLPLTHQISTAAVSSLTRSASVAVTSQRHPTIPSTSSGRQMLSPRRFSEIQALQTRLLDFITHNNSHDLVSPSTTVNLSHISSATQSETLLGSSCDENSDNNNEDDEDDEDLGDDESRTDPMDSYASASGIRLRNLWNDRNGPPGSFSSTISDCRSARPPTIGEEDATWMKSNPNSSLQPSRLKDGRCGATRLSRSGSSFNCSTTASISGRSTSSSVSKAFRSSFVEDGAASSKSSLGGASARQRCGELSSSARTDTSTSTPGPTRLLQLTGRGSNSQDYDEEYNQTGNCGMTGGGGGEDGPWNYTPLKTARESTAGREARRNSLGLGTVPPSKLPMNAAPVKRVEAKNEASGRLFRMVHKATVGRPGVLCTQTRIEVIDTSIESQPTLFTVRHSDPNLWGRQMKVHKNILLACRLVGIEVPKEIEIPIDSRKMFEQNDNVQHMNNYLERIVPHIKIGHIARGVQLYWWKAIGNGLAVLQNQISGKLVLLKNPERTVASAVDRIVKLLNCSKLKSSAFWDPEPGYPNLDLVEEQLQDSGTSEVILDTIDDLITRIWGAEERVSPLETEFILKVQATKFLRYSIGTDARDPKTLLIQVHLNEPLSRGMNAYPVCMVPMVSPSLCLRDIRLTFLQCVWFLRKLYDLHCEAESTHYNSHQHSSSSNSPLSPASSDVASTALARVRISESVAPPSRLDSDLSSTRDSLNPPRPESSATRCTPRMQHSSSVQPKSARDPSTFRDLQPVGSRASPGRLTSRVTADEFKKTFRSSRQQLASGEARRQRSPFSNRDEQWAGVPTTGVMAATNFARMQQPRTPVPIRKERTSTTGNVSIRFGATSAARRGIGDSSGGPSSSATRQDATSTPRLRSQTATSSLARPVFQLGSQGGVHCSGNAANNNKTPRRPTDDSVGRPSRMGSNQRAPHGGNGETRGLIHGDGETLKHSGTRQLSSGESARDFASTPERLASASGLRAARFSNESNGTRNLISSAGTKQLSPQRSGSRNVVAAGISSISRVGVYIRERGVSKPSTDSHRPSFAGSTSRNGRTGSGRRRTSLTLPSTKEGAVQEESEESSNNASSN